MNIIEEKDSNERYQISENDEERLTYDIKVLKLGKLSSKRHIYNVDKVYDERN